MATKTNSDIVRENLDQNGRYQGAMRFRSTTTDMVYKPVIVDGNCIYLNSGEGFENIHTGLDIFDQGYEPIPVEDTVEDTIEFIIVNRQGKTLVYDGSTEDDSRLLMTIVEGKDDFGRYIETRRRMTGEKTTKLLLAIEEHFTT